MEESPFIDKVLLEHRSAINEEDKVSRFINEFKEWKVRELQLLLHSHIVPKISNIPIPITEIHDNIVWKFTGDGNFSVKTAA